MNGKLWFRFFLMGLMLTALVLSGCEGDDGDDGSVGAAGAAGASAYDIAVENGFEGTYEEYAALVTPGGVAAQIESCATCHGDVGDEHQMVYDAAFTYTIDAKVTSVTSVATATGYNSTIFFDITQNELPYIDAAGLPSLARQTYQMMQYNSATATFDNTVDDFEDADYVLDALGDIVPGSYFVTTESGVADYAGDDANAQAYVYVTKDPILKGPDAQHITLYDEVSNTGLAGVDVTYNSVANVDGCVKCHGTPYGKHGYRQAAEVDTNLPDFAACKGCHYDTRTGGHEDWQYMGDDPEGWATGAPSTVDYAYIANVMNDTHMSHAFEFPYPQSLANCATCHFGGDNLERTLANENFTLTTCKSCHPQTGGTDLPDADGDYTVDTTVYALNTIIPHSWSDTTVCILCHNAGASGIAPVLSEIHNGYDQVIYDEDNGEEKYSENITVTFDSASLDGTTITVEALVETEGYAAADVELGASKFGLYAYDSDDLLASRINGVTADDYITTIDANTLMWTITADFSEYADAIDSGTVNRAQIMLQPRYYNSDGDMVALNAPANLVELADGSFTDPVDFVDVTKCNACHDALATTFHSPDRGGSIEACKTCHVATRGGSHLEMQSRDIDSYVHAIHSMQYFDYGNVDFNDPVEAALYYEHTEDFVYPYFTTLACESCHNAGTYNVPDQSVSLAVIQSASDSNDTTTRNIGAVPSYVTGPASNACGGCHRAMLINEDDAGGLAAFNAHVTSFGYLIEEADGVLETVWESVQSLFD
jgi:hypothetical protein